MTTFSDNTLERQLSSLFRAEAGQVHLPQGTWQAISPKMGEPDKQSLLFWIRSVLTFPRWRNPLMRITQMKYAAPAATIALAAIAAILFVLLVNDDADSDSPVPAVSPTVPVQPTDPPATPDLQATVQAANDSATATAEAQETTSVESTTVPLPTVPPAPTTPAATATRLPAPTAVPTATPPPPIQVPQLTAVEKGNALPVPDEINPSLEPQESGIVIETWAELLSESRVQVIGVLDSADFNENTPQGQLDFGVLDTAFCGNGIGVILDVGTNQSTAQIGEAFTWSITHSPANQWFSPNLRIQFLNPNLIPDFTFGSRLFNAVPGAAVTYALELKLEDSVLTPKIDLFNLLITRMADPSEICSQIAG